MSGFDPAWLVLREPYDHTARSAGLARRFAAAVGPDPELLDLGCGTGSNLRYLAPLIPGPQRWRCIDRDRRLLKAAPAAVRAWAEARGWPIRDDGDGLVLARPQGAIAVSFTCADLAQGLPERDHLGGITASALLDLTSAAWLDAFAARYDDWPLLLSLSFDGRLEFAPAAPGDDAIRARFVAHQCSDKGFGRALGPAAAGHLAGTLAARSCEVALERADWTLGPGDRPLLDATCEGILAAARAIGNDALLERWAARRHRQLAAGDLRLTIGHLDLLALPA
jgi:SAM-dependent methyltransferase